MNFKKHLRRVQLTEAQNTTVKKKKKSIIGYVQSKKKTIWQSNNLGEESVMFTEER